MFYCKYVLQYIYEICAAHIPWSLHDVSAEQAIVSAGRDSASGNTLTKAHWDIWATETHTERCVEQKLLFPPDWSDVICEDETNMIFSLLF